VSTHVTDITDLLWFEDLTDVHLVLHSYAGILAGPIAGGAADRLSSISLLGGFITRSGECLLDVEPDEVAARYRHQAESVGDGWLVPTDPSFLTQWGVTDSDLAAWVGPRLTDFPLRCQVEPPPSTRSHWPGCPRPTCATPVHRWPASRSPTDELSPKGGTAMTWSPAMT